MKRVLIILLLSSNAVLFSQKYGEKIKINEETYMYSDISSFVEQTLLPVGTILTILQSVNQEGYYFVNADQYGNGYIAGPIIELEYERQEYLKESIGNQPVISFSVGCSVFNADPKNGSGAGLSIGLSMFNLYVDFANNLARGKGNFIEYTSDESYPVNKVNLSVFNAGYNINIKKNWVITPLIGIGMSGQIMQEPGEWPTYSYGDVKFRFNIGLKTDLYFSPNAGIMLGISTFEYFKGGLVFRF